MLLLSFILKLAVAFSDLPKKKHISSEAPEKKNRKRRLWPHSVQGNKSTCYTLKKIYISIYWRAVALKSSSSLVILQWILLRMTVGRHSTAVYSICYWNWNVCFRVREQDECDLKNSHWIRKDCDDIKRFSSCEFREEGNFTMASVENAQMYTTEFKGSIIIITAIWGQIRVPIPGVRNL